MGCALLPLQGNILTYFSTLQGISMMKFSFATAWELVGLFYFILFLIYLCLKSLLRKCLLCVKVQLCFSFLLVGSFKWLNLLVNVLMEV